MSVKYAFIASEEGTCPITKMCLWAQVSRSGYDNWSTRPLSATARRRDTLTELVVLVFGDSDGRYGYRRVHGALDRSGWHTDPDTIRLIMREQGLVACQPRLWRPTTTVAGDAAGLPDLLHRDFTATEPAAKLVGDITYIRTWQGWLYLATVLDCFSKKVVGYAMVDHMRTELVTAALGMAARNGRIRPGVTIVFCQVEVSRFITKVEPLQHAFLSHLATRLVVV